MNFPPYDMYPTPTAWVPASGVLSSARGATAEKGRLMAENVSSRIATALGSEFKRG